METHLKTCNMYLLLSEYSRVQTALETPVGPRSST